MLALVTTLLPLVIALTVLGAVAYVGITGDHNRRSLAVHAATIVGLLAVPRLFAVAFEVSLQRGSAGELLPWWLPRFGTVGETVLVYTQLLETASILSVIAALVIAYRYGRCRETDPGTSQTALQ